MNLTQKLKTASSEDEEDDVFFVIKSQERVKETENYKERDGNVRNTFEVRTEYRDRMIWNNNYGEQWRNRMRQVYYNRKKYSKYREKYPNQHHYSQEERYVQTKPIKYKQKQQPTTEKPIKSQYHSHQGKKVQPIKEAPKNEVESDEDAIQVIVFKDEIVEKKSQIKPPKQIILTNFRNEQSLLDKSISIMLQQSIVFDNDNQLDEATLFESSLYFNKSFISQAESSIYKQVIISVKCKGTVYRFGISKIEIENYHKEFKICKKNDIFYIEELENILKIQEVGFKNEKKYKSGFQTKLINFGSLKFVKFQKKTKNRNHLLLKQSPISIRLISIVCFCDKKFQLFVVDNKASHTCSQCSQIIEIIIQRFIFS